MVHASSHLSRDDARWWPKTNGQGERTSPRRMQDVDVRTAGSASWRVAIEDDQTTHAVLYVRDACRLTPEDPMVPPRLVGEVPDLSSALTDSDRTQASVSWLDWWGRVVRFEGVSQLGGFSTQRDVVRERGAVFDPPDFQTLSRWPSLQSITRMTCEQALRWHKRSHTPSAQDRKRWQVMKAVVDEVCTDFQVDPSRLNAAVISLTVQGTWWHHPRLGVLLCSQGVLDDEELFAPLLRDAFTQGLAPRW